MKGMYPTDKSTETRYFLMLSQNGTKLNFGTIRRLSYVTSQSIVQDFDHKDKAKVTDASEQYEVDVNDQPIYVCFWLSDICHVSMPDELTEERQYCQIIRTLVAIRYIEIRKYLQVQRHPA
jgi:hypothetical protein